VLSRLSATISEHGLLHKGDRVLVGLSGGPDSWALLLGLQKLSARLQIEVEAVCVDHGLRVEAAAEAKAVSEQCKALGIRCHTVRLTDLKARTGKVSMDAARTSRLDALRKLARRRHCNRIALGHHADDQAETVLFRIVRGTGIAGLSGIPYQRDEFIRPLLDVRRSEIERFVRKQGIVPVQDPSNANPRYARARIRHTLLPLLRQENPRVVEALNELARQARNTVGPAESAGLNLPRQAARTLEKLLRNKNGTQTVDVRGGRVEVRYGASAFVPSPKKTAPAAKSTAPQPITRSGTYLAANETRLHIRLAARTRPSEKAIAFDAQQIQLPLVLRTRQPGDRMRPRGGTGSRKLQDLMVDARIPRPERLRWPVLTDTTGTILYVPGCRPAESGRPNTSTQRWLVVEIAGEKRSRRRPVEKRS
jgi:tRNA(Ile)-lysidine synthase